MPAFGVKTNERPGTRAQARYVRMSAYKARQVLDLIRNKEVQQADEILQFAERDAAIVIRKCLASAMANAENNDGIDATELYVSACYADEGPTLKRWRPRARASDAHPQAHLPHHDHREPPERRAARAPPPGRGRITVRRRPWPPPRAGRDRVAPPARRQEPSARAGSRPKSTITITITSTTTSTTTRT